MRLIVADTSSIFYLLSIGQIELLPRLFKKVFVPDAVHGEFCHPTAPAVLHAWADERQSWLEVIPVDPIDDPTLRSLGAGEQAAIILALSLHADLILIDERKRDLCRDRQRTREFPSMLDDLLDEFPGKS